MNPPPFCACAGRPLTHDHFSCGSAEIIPATGAESCVKTPADAGRPSAPGLSCCVACGGILASAPVGVHAVPVQPKFPQRPVPRAEFSRLWREPRHDRGGLPAAPRRGCRSAAKVSAHAHPRLLRNSPHSVRRSAFPPTRQLSGPAVCAAFADTGCDNATNRMTNSSTLLRRVCGLGIMLTCFHRDSWHMSEPSTVT